MKYTDFKKNPVVELVLSDIVGSEQNGKVSHLNYVERNSIDGKVLAEGKAKTFLKLEDIDVQENGVATNVRLSNDGIWLISKTGTAITTEGFGRKI